MVLEVPIESAVSLKSNVRVFKFFNCVFCNIYLLILFPKAFRTQREYFQQIRHFDSRALLLSECANEQSWIKQLTEVFNLISFNSLCMKNLLWGRINRFVCGNLSKFWKLSSWKYWVHTINQKRNFTASHFHVINFCSCLN